MWGRGRRVVAPPQKDGYDQMRIHRAAAKRARKGHRRIADALQREHSYHAAKLGWQGRTR